MKKTILTLGYLTALISPLASHANHFASLLSQNDRPTADKLRDINRKPERILALVDIQPNMTVVDFIAGRGYYTDIFARVLNNSGKLFAVKAKLADRDLSKFKNITELQELDLSDLTVQADRIFTALNYHDLVNKDELNRQQLLASIYNKLKDDGYFIVIDHNAAPGTGRSTTKKLHRIENTFVLNEILNAGFILEQSSSALANPNDDYQQDVWQTNTKGLTDRFVYKFKKPKALK
ncbi:class I SAM-dependent methyltransferase [Pseudoalteromonas sp. S16_S37]|uniref:class I SAM-dependent methyltransferase n=1 Tax=Pseudoalteromonas sp. S16_S37 TaxID=2720228 RepID=UPI001680EECB|nr:class I SAM-dependent methyltransferase [Pseudoalteromonas sp. S16_S37]MBD1584259.1 class I SAM-dependent methyltransferase [Pseudoalteromonas sp. S16_S37]